MDRWSGDDSFDRAPRRPQGSVARGGISSFTKAQQGAGWLHLAARPAERTLSLGGKSAGTSQPVQQSFPKVEVVASRREQRQAAQAPPPATPAAVQAQPQPAAPPESLPAPAWAAAPPSGWRLQVVKDGQTLQDVPLDKSAFLFGRWASGTRFCWPRCNGGSKLLSMPASFRTRESTQRGDAARCAGVYTQTLCVTMPPCRGSMRSWPGTGSGRPGARSTWAARTAAS